VLQADTVYVLPTHLPNIWLQMDRALEGLAAAMMQSRNLQDVYNGGWPPLGPAAAAAAAMAGAAAGPAAAAAALAVHTCTAPNRACSWEAACGSGIIILDKLTVVKQLQQHAARPCCRCLHGCGHGHTMWDVLLAKACSSNRGSSWDSVRLIMFALVVVLLQTRLRPKCCRRTG
jgi:hypothetical protein